METGFLKTGMFGLLVLFAIGMTSANLGAQELFSGSGIRSTDSDQPAAKSRWPKLLDFSKSEPTSRGVQPFSGLSSRKVEPAERPAKGVFSLPSFEKPKFEKPTFEKPSFDWLKRKPNLSDNRESTPFAGFTDKMPKRDPNNPGLFQQMNTKSKNFFEKTTGWAHRKNQNMKEKSNETWDSIAKDLRDYQQQNPQNNTSPAQPPVRTAEAPSQSKIRF